MIKKRLRYIEEQFKNFPNVVYIGFSGGKDSSAVVKLLYNAAKARPENTRRFVVVYCDTGVENPVIDRYARATLSSLEAEALDDGLPFECRIIEPEVDRSFFVRIIGRGYPPPTNSFRWCTTDIRIRPFQHFLRSQSGSTLIAIGTRMGESQQRDRSLRRSVDFDIQTTFYQKQRDGFPGAILFTPIIDFDLGDVWQTLVDLEAPRSINAEILARIYKDGSGECPTIRDFKDKPCSKARFGCWTCTVVRRDRSAERMIATGYEELLPFNRFRQWLLSIRNDPRNRCKRRRNGSEGLGPFTLRARAMILTALGALEFETGRQILSPEQRRRIEELWQLDSSSAEYFALE
jgi:DNA sulfur modification protein DndC